MRDYDLFARIGGEEFAILLPATEAELGYVIAERIRSSVESLEIPFEAQKLAITTSIGMVENSKEITSFEQMILLADKHLNQAKLKGRNTVLYT
ncbi:GGDEF domain-containing protein [Thalassotalea piscium]|uniref:GGDEF domain-containing protein n=1 Tax=Thalassotalea piscium TaxID=1230533 RepID=UPI00361763E7